MRAFTYRSVCLVIWRNVQNSATVPKSANVAQYILCDTFRTALYICIHYIYKQINNTLHALTLYIYKGIHHPHPRKTPPTLPSKYLVYIVTNILTPHPHTPPQSLHKPPRCVKMSHMPKSTPKPERQCPKCLSLLYKNKYGIHSIPSVAKFPKLKPYLCYYCKHNHGGHRQQSEGSTTVISV